MIRRELACRAEMAEPSIERLLRKTYGWICNHGTSVGRPALALFGLWFSTLSPGKDGLRRRRRSRPGMCFTTAVGGCCRWSAVTPMLSQRPSTPYAPRRMRCIFQRQCRNAQPISFVSHGLGAQAEIPHVGLTGAIGRRFDPGRFPPSPPKI